MNFSHLPIPDESPEQLDEIDEDSFNGDGKTIQLKEKVTKNI